MACRYSGHNGQLADAPDARPRSLIRAQIALEYALQADGLLVPFPGSTEQARFIVHRHSAGYMRFFRCDLPADIRRRLEALPGPAAFDNREAVRAILAAQAACKNAFFGTSAVFRDRPDPAEFADEIRTDEGCAVQVGGMVASIAWSVRENAAAAELAVETAEGHRRRGYARQVAAAWAHEVIKQGKVAYYSYPGGNLASEALARNLGVVEFSIVAAYR